MRDRSDDRFPGVRGVGLVGIVLVGVFFLAMGLHSISTGLPRERPARPYLQVVLGSLMFGSAAAELIRRWWRNRAAGRHR